MIVDMSVRWEGDAKRFGFVHGGPTCNDHDTWLPQAWRE